MQMKFSQNTLHANLLFIFNWLVDYYAEINKIQYMNRVAFSHPIAQRLRQAGGRIGIVANALLLIFTLVSLLHISGAVALLAAGFALVLCVLQIARKHDDFVAVFRLFSPLILASIPSPAQPISRLSAPAKRPPRMLGA